ncbi:MAG: hypothetical protein V3T05_00800 [Myxococcota bacterium]
MKRLFAGLTIVVLPLTLAACGEDSLHGLPSDALQIASEPECVSSLDCGPDAKCVDNVCVDSCATPPCDPPPSDPPPSDPPLDVPPPDFPLWVGGQWDTEYHLDWSDYLGPLAGLGSEIDFIDQLLVGNTSIADLPIIGGIIQDIVDNNIPDWVVDLVHILNNVVHFFQDVRIEARMSLGHVTGSPNQLTGTELWDWGFVQIIDQCPLGELDPGYPQCADMPVPLNQFITSAGVIGAEAQDFTGTLTGTEVFFGGREVRMQISQFVLFIIDHLTRLATGGQYQTLNDALTSLIDCVAFTTQVESFLCDMGTCGPQPAVLGACVATRDQIIGEVTNTLEAITVDWEVMQFDARAVVIDDPVDGSADKLGDPPGNPGNLENGEFQVLLGADLQGTWSAIRP